MWFLNKSSIKVHRCICVVLCTFQYITYVSQSAMLSFDGSIESFSCKSSPDSAAEA